MGRKVVFSCDGPGCDFSEATEGEGPINLTEATVTFLGSDCWKGWFCNSCVTLARKRIVNALTEMKV